MVKKVLVFLLLTVVCFTMFTGCGGSTNTAGSGTTAASGDAQATTQGAAQGNAAPAGPVFDKPVTLRLMTPNSPSWPYQEDWYVLKMIKEKTNVSFEWITVNEDTFDEKLNTMMASGDVPELTFNFNVPAAQRYGSEGAYANILDHSADVPNFTAWVNDNKDYVGDFKSADGSLYVMPDKGIQETDRMGWMYRKDIFDKNGLKVPTNETEFLDVLRQLKKLYPESYPFSERGLDGAIPRLEFLAGGWGTSYCGNHPFYYDYDKKEWRFGPIEDNFKTMVEFYHQMLAEKLMPPDTLTLDTKGWQDIVSTNKAFITFEYLGRIDFFNTPMRKENPEFTMAYMAPPKFGANGVAKNAFTAYAGSGWSLAAKSPKLKDALKYMDWMYTPEAKELFSWGEEGKTYNTVDGKKKFIGVTDIASMRKTYGLSTNGTYALFDFDSHNSLSSKELSEAIVEARKYDLPSIPSVSLTDEELGVYSKKYDTIQSHVAEAVSQFLLGNKPFSEWDSYVKEIQSLGLQDLIDIYTKAYQRQMGG